MRPATSPRRAIALCSAPGGQPRLHSFVDAVADDPVGERILDRTQVELALTSTMLSNISEPQLIWRISDEVPLDQIVMSGRARPAVLAALHAEHAPQSIVRADPPGSALGHRLAGVAGLLDEVAVPELGVITVGIEQGVGAVSLDEFGVGDGFGQPAIIGLASELEYPARHRDGEPLGGELFHERVEPFPAGWPATGRRRPGAGPRSLAPPA